MAEREELAPSSRRADFTADEIRGSVRGVLEARSDKTTLSELFGALPAASEALEFYPWRRRLDSQESVLIDDLVLAPAALFVTRCYRLLLRRDPSTAELSAAEGKLRLGLGRAPFVALLRYGAEGRRAGVPVEGLAARLLPKPLRPKRDSLHDAESLSARRSAAPMSTRSRPPAVPARRPVLSICVTTYNRAKWLTHSLPLILEQSAPYAGMVEVLVCDNASPDDTEQVASQFLEHAHFSYYRNEKNVGMLGNLGKSCERARGRYIWVIGDDDLLVLGTLERVLLAIANHPSIELIYTNYAYTHFDRPEEIQDANAVIHAARAISPRVEDAFAERLSEIAARSENCFTAIYCLIYREDHARLAYGQDTSGRPFSTLPSTVPSADYVCRHMLGRPAYWIGRPCTVVNLNVSWLRYATLFILERFPELFDLMQEKGVPAADVDQLRSEHVRQIPGWFTKIFTSAEDENRPLFSPERLVRRFGHLPAFVACWPELRDIYRRAWDEGRAGVGAPTVADLQAILLERAGKSS
ncbi:MAG TPA: glycosyltransferase family 2 protein [Polyangiaceae bacterium]|jgi:glycosyltransferase involved in cell wall biosynthesis